MNFPIIELQECLLDPRGRNLAVFPFMLMPTTQGWIILLNFHNFHALFTRNFLRGVYLDGNGAWIMKANFPGDSTLPNYDLPLFS